MCRYRIAACVDQDYTEVVLCLHVDGVMDKSGRRRFGWVLLVDSTVFFFIELFRFYVRMKQKIFYKKISSINSYFTSKLLD